MTELAKTVDQALSALLSLGFDGPASTGELARRLGLNRTVCHRLLATCEHRGFVRRSAHGWELGSSVAALAKVFEANVRTAAGPALSRLATDCGETAVLSVPEGDQAVALDQVVATQQLVQVRYQPGFRHPLARGAHGKAILAWCEPALVERAAAQVDDHAALRAELAAIRERGLAFTRDELQFGAYGIAAPVFDAHGRICASLGVVAPLERMPHGGVLDWHASAAVRTAASLANERLARQAEQADADISARLAEG